MSNKFKINWIKPPAAYVAREGLTMIMTDVNVIWHNEDDVEVTTFFQYPLPKSERVKRSLLSQGYDTAKRAIRGEPNEVYPQCYKNVSDREKFDRKWNAAKHLFLSRFHSFIAFIINPVFGFLQLQFVRKSPIPSFG